jgi:hypothetical protein
MILKRIPNIVAWFITFHIVTLSWVFFRCETFSNAVHLLRRLTSGWTVRPSSEFITGINPAQLAVGVLVTAILVIVEFLSRGGRFDQYLDQKPILVRRVVMYSLLLLIINFAMFQNPQKFIYFQF